MQAYSIDLRIKVISYIKKGNSQKLATEVFNLNKATVNRWWLRYKQEGHVKPRENKGRKAKIDRAELKRYVESQPNSMLRDIGLKFKVSANSVHKCLKKLGFSYKKKPSPMWKQTKRSVLSI